MTVAGVEAQRQQAGLTWKPDRHCGQAVSGSLHSEIRRYSACVAYSQFITSSEKQQSIGY
jgi:hypothetical protein